MIASIRMTSKMYGINMIIASCMVQMIEFLCVDESKLKLDAKVLHI